jgi:hypothetical protein
MKTMSRLVIAAVLAAASAGAMAHGRVHMGVYVGPYWGPWWVVPPPVYYPAPVVVEREAPIIIEQTDAPPDYWYFCRPANAYYPYVKECPAPWERVPAKPAR